MEGSNKNYMNIILNYEKYAKFKFNRKIDFSASGFFHGTPVHISRNSSVSRSTG
jgi:hypothetical protein